MSDIPKERHHSLSLWFMTVMHPKDMGWGLSWQSYLITGWSLQDKDRRRGQDILLLKELGFA